MLAVTAFVIVAFFAIREGEELLAFMAASGSGRITFGLLAPTQGPLNGIETFLVLASIILLIWIPQVFFSIQLDMAGTGDAQRVLLGLITTISCAMTGACFVSIQPGVPE